MQTSLTLLLRRLLILIVHSAKSTRLLLLSNRLKVTDTAKNPKNPNTNSLFLLLTLVLSYLPFQSRKKKIAVGEARMEDEQLLFREEQEERKRNVLETDYDEKQQDDWQSAKDMVNLPRRQKTMALSERDEAKSGMDAKLIEGAEFNLSLENKGRNYEFEQEYEQEPEPELARGQGRNYPKNITLDYENSPSTFPTEFYSSLEEEWKQEDLEYQESNGLGSDSVIWMPILLFLRAVSIGLTLAFSPMFFVLKTVFGINTENAKFWEVPLERRKQTAVTFFLLMFYPLGGFFSLVALILLFVPGINFFVLMYLMWIFRWDDSSTSGERHPFMRYWKVWRHFANYFPIRLIKTHNLDPRGKYMFLYHPHGIIPVGVLGNFAMDATGFSRKFPGIDVRFLTLDTNFRLPVMRELFLSLGLCSASRKSCLRILNRGPGSAIGIAIGGAEEALDSKPGTYRLLMREGCIRIALETGASLVPVLGFGETDVYDSYVYPDGSWIRYFQSLFKRIVGFSFPVFHGRGLFNYSMGVMPHRTPIYTVVGKPIKVPRAPEHLRGGGLSTTPEGRALVAKYREEYIDALTELYNHFKNKWAVDRVESLQIQVKRSAPRKSRKTK